MSPRSNGPEFWEWMEEKAYGEHYEDQEGFKWTPSFPKGYLLHSYDFRVELYCRIHVIDSENEVVELENPHVSTDSIPDIKVEHHRLTLWAYRQTKIARDFCSARRPEAPFVRQ